MYEPVLTDEKLDLYNVYEVHIGATLNYLITGR